MDLAEFLQQLTKQGMGICGRYPKYGIAFELRVAPDESGIILKWWTVRKRGSALGKNPRLTLFKPECQISVAELKQAALAQIDRMIAAENARLEEEAFAIASASEASIQLAAAMAVYDF